MYAWKCWHDSWTRFLLCALMASIMVGAIAMGHAMIFTQGGAHLARYTDARSASALWNDLGDTVGSLMLVMQIVALFLGSVGVGEEHGKYTLEFLLTRPRARWYYIRTAWLVGLAELVGVAILAFATAMAVVIWSTGQVQNWRLLLATVPLVLVPTMLTYSLTYLLTTAFKNGRTGLLTALAVLICYEAVTGYLLHSYRLCAHIPLCSVQYSTPGKVLRYVFDRTASFPAFAVVIWMGIAVAMLWPATRIFERQEI